MPVFPTEMGEIFVPPIVEEQFFSIPQIEGLRAERALMRAVLEDAIDCFIRRARKKGGRKNGVPKSGRRPMRLSKEAEEWLFSDDEEWPFSFVNICRFLGLEENYIRRCLKKLAAEREVLRAA